MQQIPLGSQGLTTFPLGLGCMGMSAFYGGATESGSVETIRRALDLGITLFDTAEIYGPFENEQLLGLGTDHVDLWYLRRVDPNVPIEESIGAMGEAVTAGKARYVGVSETSAETLRRAHSTFPITAIQSEYSLFERDAEHNGVLVTARELGIGFVPFSPLGRGFLTGTVTRKEDLPEGDARRNLPRFSDEAIDANLRVVDAPRSHRG
nr:aldo/keto reductase [Curtobacterium sp. TXMA1]